MAQSRENKIDYFRSVTNWSDRLFSYVRMESFAIDIYLIIAQTPANEESVPNETKPEESLIESSPRLFNSMSLADTTTGYPNRTSFVDYVEQLPPSVASRTSSMFVQLDKFSQGILKRKPRICPNHTIHRLDQRKLLQYVDSNVIGRDRWIQTPWGRRKLIYADYTASGRALRFIEEFIMQNVLPYYANTHSENNACALQTTRFRESARKLIKKLVNAMIDDVAIFTGSGSTGAINKLVSVLNLNNQQVREQYVVFVSTFEHHSNILPWKETGVELIRITNTSDGLLDQNMLEDRLKFYALDQKKHIICTFNAASNVTGIRTDVDAVSALVHRYNGRIFWDYAAAAPYVKIDMNPSVDAYKDAVFISTHKFVGGPGTPGKFSRSLLILSSIRMSILGILIAKKSLFQNPVPCNCGGGTVNYVTRNDVEYIHDIEGREEGGTPDILGAIRAGLVMHLKDAIGCDLIEAREEELVKKFLRCFKKHPTLVILGSTTVPRLAIFSFLIYVKSSDKYLHHHFVCVLLNDLFGIQVRSGCLCAGPYVLDLLNIDDHTATIYSDFITQDANGRFDFKEQNALMKPGFTRFNLSYFASDKEVDYILDALDFIATDGWKFLPLYTYDLTTASWHLRDHKHNVHDFAQFHSLRMITYENGTLEEDFSQRNLQLTNTNVLPQLVVTSSSDDPLEQAKAITLNIANYVYENVDFRIDPPLNVPDEYRRYIWFVQPRDIILKMLIDHEKQREHATVPFRP
ncbi:unnamed protein product [Adineta ricciae]|uniref:Aminotransferase class V domain-containing protein n=1 Tax=Adineta ricciae TaxID=249248 RepID=A0A814YCH1_ADIRI|nr:unnamed protein product [Adineta ricciae]